MIIHIINYYKINNSISFLLTFILLFFAQTSKGNELKKASNSPIIIAIDADMSSGSAHAGESIRRGSLIAIEEINEQGGVLGGRKLKLIVKDHHGSPSRSADNILELAQVKNLVAIMGGLHSPAIIYNHNIIHKHKLIFLDPWAAATKVIKNGFKPNYIFRISVRDQFVGGFIVSTALKRGYTKIGLLLEKTGWGRGNNKSITKALAIKGLTPASVEWFHWGDTDMTTQIVNLENKGAEVIIMVANAPEGSAIVKSLANRPPDKRVPIISHWGITGGEFIKLCGDSYGKIKLEVLQTYSFMNTKRKQGHNLIKRYKKMFNVHGPEGIIAPVGTAHAYDLIKILAMAIKKAGTINRAKVRLTLEHIPKYEGVVKDYTPPFSEKWHEGLDSSDYHLSVYDKKGILIPIK